MILETLTVTVAAAAGTVLGGCVLRKLFPPGSDSAGVRYSPPAEPGIVRPPRPIMRDVRPVWRRTPDDQA